MRKVAIFIVFFALVFVLCFTEASGSDTFCAEYTPLVVDDSFRYLNEIYIEEYPEIALRFMYGTPDDKEVLSNLAEMITDGCETDKEKADAIEKWIQRNIEYSGSASAYLMDTFYNRCGDCLGYAQLMVALLRLEDIPAAWGDGWRGDMESLTHEDMWGLPAGHAWCYAYLDGEWVLYDPLWFTGGTTDKEYVAKWYYVNTIEAVIPIYNETSSYRLNSCGSCYYKDGVFFAHTNLILNNLFLLSQGFTAYDGYSYVDSSKNEDNMISGEAYRDGWLWSGSKVYIYENGICAAGTIIEDDSKVYYCDKQTGYAFEILCDSNDYSIIGGCFCVPVGIQKKILADTTSFSALGGYSVVWESDDPSIASIDNDGVISTLKEGVVILSAHFYRDSDGQYMGSSCLFNLYVCDNERIPDYSDTLTDHEHNYKAITKEVYIIYTCTVEGCDDGHIGDTLVNDHFYSCIETNATCINLGYRTYTCSCGHQYIESFGELQDHDWSDWIKDDTESGFPERICTICGLIEYQGVVANGQCGDNTTWFLTEEGCLLIKGSGDMTDYYFSGAPWVNYSNIITSVIIEDGITSIGGWSFAWCENLTQITMPDSLTKIGDWAFHCCSALSKLEIPNGVTTIGEKAFYLCTSLSEINIPYSMNKLSIGIFENCERLEKIDIPQNITYIDYEAFNQCANLQEISLPLGLTYIGQAAFQGCSSLKQISIPQTVTDIGAWAFASCTSLETIEFSTNITVLEDHLFYNCTRLETFHIPDSIMKISGQLFGKCTNLKEVTISDDHSYYTILDGVLFTKNMSALIEYLPYLTDESYTIPDCVWSLENGAFSEHLYLKTIVIPQSISHFGGSIFDYCLSLEEVYFRGDAPYFSSNCWLYDVTATIYYPANNNTWTEQIMGNYFGTITWVSYDLCQAGYHLDGDDNNHDCDNCSTPNVDDGCHGGKATCKTLATCEECSQTYGSLDSSNHEETAEWKIDAEKHSRAYSCCCVTVVESEVHEWNARICTKCNYSCRIAGDINIDGKVNLKDVVLLYRYFDNWAVEVDTDALDTNGDGTVDIKDAAHLFRFVTGHQGLVLHRKTPDTQISSNE